MPTPYPHPTKNTRTQHLHDYLFAYISRESASKKVRIALSAIYNCHLIVKMKIKCPHQRKILKLPIIQYKVSTQALWHFSLQYYDVRDDGKDGIKQQLIGDSLWWLKVVDRRGQSIDEHQAFDSIVTSLFFVTVQNRGRERERHSQGAQLKKAQTTGPSQKNSILWNTVWQLHRPRPVTGTDGKSISLPITLSPPLSLSLSLSRCPFCGLLRSVIRNMK